MRESMVVKIEANIEWQVTKTPGGTLVAVCDSLGLTSEGADDLDLWLNINESMQLVLNNLLQCGELNQFLHARGWRAKTEIRSHGDSRIPFDVPFELIKQQQNRRDSARTPH